MSKVSSTPSGKAYDPKTAEVVLHKWRENKEDWPVFQRWWSFTNTVKGRGYLKTLPARGRDLEFPGPILRGFFLHFYFLRLPFFSKKVFVICFKALALSAKIQTINYRMKHQ